MQILLLKKPRPSHSAAKKIRVIPVLTLALILALSFIATGAVQVAQATTTILGNFPLVVISLDAGATVITMPTSNSPAPFTLTSSDPTIAKVNGLSVTPLRTGTVTITASQAASGAFTARSRSTQLRIDPGTPKYVAWAAQSFPIAQRTYKITPPVSTSNGGWIYTSSNPNIATISGDIVTFMDGGTISINGAQSRTLNWLAGSTSMKLTIVAVRPTIGSFGNISIMKDSVASLTLGRPTSTSPGTWTFSSSNPAVATLVGTTLTPIAFGTSIITASQARSGDFGSTSVSMTLTVQGPIPSVGTLADLTAPFTSPTLMTILIPTPTSNSTGAWTFTSSDATAVTLVGNRATLLKAGLVTISAVQAPTSTFASSTPVTMKLSVIGAPTLGAWANIEKVVKDPDFLLTPPTSTSPGAWIFTSDNPAVAEVVGSLIKVKAAGSAKITAAQAATPIYSPASARLTIVVHGAIPTIGALAPITATFGDTPIKIVAPTSNSTGAWIFSSNNKQVVSVNSGNLIVVGVGTATLTATQAASGIYSQSNTITATMTVKAKTTASPTPKPTASPSPTVKPTTSASPTPSSSASSGSGSMVGQFVNLKVEFGTVAPVLVPPSTTSQTAQTAWTYQSSNAKVVTFAGKFIVMRGIGIATITATQLGTASSSSIVRKFKIEVYPATSESAPLPKVSVKAVKRVITVSVSVSAGSAKVTINGRPAKVGKNIVKVGVHTVLVRVDKKVVYLKNFTVK